MNVTAAAGLALVVIAQVFIMLAQRSAYKRARETVALLEDHRKLHQEEQLVTDGNVEALNEHLHCAPGAG